MRTHVLLLALIAAAVPAGAQQTGGDPAPVYAIDEVEVPPRVRNPTQFVSGGDRVSGTVLVAFVVGTDGRARDVHVLSASDSRLTEPSLRMVSRMRFAPGRMGGERVAVRMELPLIFGLEPRWAGARPGERSTGRRSADRRSGADPNRYPTQIRDQSNPPAFAGERPGFSEPPPCNGRDC